MGWRQGATWERVWLCRPPVHMSLWRPCKEVIEIEEFNSIERGVYESREGWRIKQITTMGRRRRVNPTLLLCLSTRVKSGFGFGVLEYIAIGSKSSPTHFIG